MYNIIIEILVNCQLTVSTTHFQGSSDSLTPPHPFPPCVECFPYIVNNDKIMGMENQFIYIHVQHTISM